MNIFLIILIIIILITYMNSCNEQSIREYFIESDVLKFNVYQLGALTTAEVQSIPNDKIQELNENQLPAILVKLSSQQKTAITVEQKNKLTEKQRKLL